MTATDISAIVGAPEDHKYEHALLSTADQFAVAHLAQMRGAIMTDASEHYEVFQSMSNAIGEGAEPAQALLRAFPQITDGDGISHYASDVACDLYRPQTDAAYYFGLALGLRLGGGAR